MVSKEFKAPGLAVIAYELVSRAKFDNFKLYKTTSGCLPMSSRKFFMVYFSLNYQLLVNLMHVGDIATILLKPFIILKFSQPVIIRL
jgi:hypothetical protein